MSMEFSRPQTFSVTVSEKIKISAKVYQVTFRLQSPPTISFIAGQTMVLVIDDRVRRTMSIASPPFQSDRLFMAHDVSPGGPGSRWTEGLMIGDTVKIMAPTGRFVLEESPRKKVFVATGTGVAPFRSIILDHPKDSTMTLYWGLRHEEDVFWKEEFENMAAKHQNFHFALTLSHPSDSWTGMRGRVGDHVFAHEKNLAASDTYLCGNTSMITEMEERLLAASVPKIQIKREQFY